MNTFICELCNEEFNSRTAEDHAIKHGFASATEYFWKVVYKYDGNPVCKTCGAPITFYNYKRPIRYCNSVCWYSSTELSNQSSTRMKKLWNDSDFRDTSIARSSEHFKSLWESGAFDYKSDELRELRLHDTDALVSNLVARGIPADTKSYVYVAHNQEYVKVGFSTNPEIRLHGLGANIVLDSYKEFSDLKSGFIYELEFHKNHKEYLLNATDIEYCKTEIYKIEYLDKLLSDFNK